eukprot:5826250-Pyramimonas_sp.AAC.1
MEPAPRARSILFSLRCDHAHYYHHRRRHHSGLLFQIVSLVDTIFQTTPVKHVCYHWRTCMMMKRASRSHSIMFSLRCDRAHYYAYCDHHHWRTCTMMELSLIHISEPTRPEPI